MVLNFVIQLCYLKYIYVKPSTLFHLCHSVLMNWQISPIHLSNLRAKKILLFFQEVKISCISLPKSICVKYAGIKSIFWLIEKLKGMFFFMNSVAIVLIAIFFLNNRCNQASGHFSFEINEMKHLLCNHFF